MTTVTVAQSKDPFQASADSPPPIHDADHYAKRAKEDADSWRAQLKSLDQPDIAKTMSKPQHEVIRFIYSPHFSKTLVITVSRKLDKVSFQVRRFSEKQVVELTGNISIDLNTYEGVRDLFTKPEIVDPLRALTPFQRDALWGLDGSWWHVETLLSGRYTHAVVWSPESITESSDADRASFQKQFGFQMPDLKPFEDACVLLVRLAGLPLDAKNYEPREQRR